MEAVTRLFLHVADVVKNQENNVVICTVDTDVVVVALSKLSKIIADELWISFGTGKHFRYIPIHDLFATLDQP